uniref:Ciliary microtubule inner protein 2C n=1 Tax=Mus spicilegus TaxID=10103 RepID=A0A8C6H4Q0_MUSSI
MAFRSAGTLMTEFNAAFVPPALMPGYKGHVPGVASSFGSSYGNTTFKYFQDLRNTGLEKSYALLSGGRFPTIFSPNSPLVLTDNSQNWDRWLHQPTYSRSNQDNGRTTELTNFYKVVQQQPAVCSLPSCRQSRSSGSITKTRLACCPVFLTLYFL